MKTVEIIGYKRANLGKKEAQHVRKEGNVPCVLYGMGEQVHFLAPMILFRTIVYTNEAHFVDLNIEGTTYHAILQEIQFHPVSEMILHADFLQIGDARKIKMKIPVRLEGQSVGVRKGGTLVHKKTYLKVYGYPKDMPEHISVDISNLDFNSALKVSEVPKDKLEYLDAPQSSIAVIEVPRSAKMTEEEEATTEPEAGEKSDAPVEKEKEDSKK